MPTFDDLIGERGTVFTTLAYWIGSLKPDAPEKNLDPTHLGYVMGTMYDVEEQNFGGEYGDIDDFTDAYFSPTAPVTLAEKWCPLDSAAKWLGKPLWEEVEDGEFLLAAASVWKQPDFDVLDGITPSAGDEAHFLFLLQLTLHRCVERGENILLICKPGWSFDHSAKNPLGMFGYSALSAGRLYSERIPSGFFGMAN